MKTSGFGCLSLTGIFAGLFVFLFVTGVTLVKGGTLFSPGKLNAQPGSVMLNGVRSHGEIIQCSSCHAAPWETKNMSDKCIECHQNIATDTNDFHQVMLAEGERGSCRECHTDHRGTEVSLTIDNLSKFPHEKMGFSLHTHLQMADGSPFTCSDCHLGTYLSFDIKTCEACHATLDGAFMQDHLQAFNANCLNCHDGLDSYGKSFDHAKVPFALTGKHTEVVCQKCHLGMEMITDLQATPSDCTTCHIQNDPHGGRFGVDCGSCHTPEGWKPAQFDHNLANFKLTGKHIQVECEKCHSTGQYTGTPQDCYVCHGQNDVHEGQLGQACESCHTPDGWTPANFDHSRAEFQLTRKHTGVACDGCHTNNFFKGTPQDCASCHLKDDAHNGQFGTDCSMCHTPQDWKAINFNHSTTAFSLVGKHGNVACLDCHTTSSPKTTPTECYACHRKDDRHGGQFGTDCRLCHTSNAWSQITFDHSRAAFQLTGAHIQVNCQSCHSGGEFKGTPTTCYACHKVDDHHNGQYGTDCGTCHSTQTWKGATFDHARASFQLTGAHAQAACTQCHSGGKYKGTPSACAACHSEPNFHQGVLGTDCGACHSTSRWTPASYTGPHTFPMNHGDPASCSTCHPSSLGSWTCYSCHDQGEITHKHQEENIGDFSNCIRCHPAGSKEEGGDD